MNWITNLQMTWGVLLEALGGIAILAGGIRVIISFLHPFKTMKERVDKHDELLDRDNQRLRNEAEATKVTMRVLLALIDHEITGNSVEKLQQAKEVIRAYLIDR